VYIIQPNPVTCTTIEDITLVKPTEDLIFCVGAPDNFERFNKLITETFFTQGRPFNLTMNRADQSKLLRMCLVRKTTYQFGKSKNLIVFEACFVQTQAHVNAGTSSSNFKTLLKLRPALFDRTTGITHTITSQRVNSLPFGEQLNNKKSYLAYSGNIPANCRLVSPETKQLSESLNAKPELITTIDLISLRGGPQTVFKQTPHPKYPNALESVPEKLSQEELTQILTDKSFCDQHAQLIGVSTGKYLQMISELTMEEVHLRVLQGGCGIQEITTALMQASKVLEHIKAINSSLDS